MSVLDPSQYGSNVHQNYNFVKFWRWKTDTKTKIAYLLQPHHSSYGITVVQLQFTVQVYQSAKTILYSFTVNFTHKL